MQPPESSEYGSFYANYIAHVPPGDIVDLLDAQGKTTSLFLSKINEHTSRYRYDDGKWSVREVVGHLCDTERVMVYRAVRIARGDTTPMPGFDENMYAANSGAHSIPLEVLTADLKTLRASTVSFLRLVTDEQALRVGTASDNPFSVRALAYIIAGHEIHHMNVIRDRYLS